MAIGAGQRLATKHEFEALKGSFFFDPESKRLLANGLGQVFPAGNLRAK